MINDDINNVPDKTIAVFLDDVDCSFSKDRISNIIAKPEKTRDWFSNHFYRCLPLTIGNTYGFVIKNEFPFSVVWDGGDSLESLKIYHNLQGNENVFPYISSAFGHGILTIDPPFSLRTPPGVNLMTINPPNYIIPAVTVMTGVVEADNLRRNFTFNLKIQIPNIEITFPKGTPLSGFIPIPRYYADSFNIQDASEIFSEDIVIEEIQARNDECDTRKTVDVDNPYMIGKRYMRGVDVYDNKFKDHQSFPTSKKQTKG